MQVIRNQFGGTMVKLVHKYEFDYKFDYKRKFDYKHHKAALNLNFL